MCKFFSSILLKNGDLLYNDSLNNHEDIINFFNIRDNEFNSNKFIRLEYCPESIDDYGDINKYKVIVDEKFIPDWFEEYEEATIDKLKSIVGKKIITASQKILCCGIYIIGKDVVINRVINAEIYVNYGTVIYNGGILTNNYGTVTNNYGTVTNNNNGTVTNNYGTVTKNYGIVTNNNGTVTNNNNGTVTNNDGTLTKNYGIVTNNNGTVTNNNGTVTNNNNGTVIYNNGTVTNNNNGTVTNNNNGTVTNNNNSKKL